MSEQIIIQPNGKYAIWSTIVDDFTYINVSSEDELIEIFLHREKQNIIRRVNDIIKKLKNKEKPYYQFTNTFEECIDIIKDIHGKNAESLFLLKDL